MNQNMNMEYLLLKRIAEAKKPIGAGYLADTLNGEGENAMSEATIGRYLRKMEQKGLLKSEKYSGRSRGRIITDRGLQLIKEHEEERRQEEFLQDTLEIFTNVYGEQLKNVLIARQIIEPEVAALAAENACEEDIAEIGHIVEDTAKLVGKGESMAAKDAPFHIAIARATGNPVLAAVMKMIRSERDYSPEIERIIHLSSLNNSSDHRSIYLAIKERNPEKARQIMKQHIYNLQLRFEEYERKGNKV